MRPKVFLDIKTSRLNSFSEVPHRLNFSKVTLIRLPVKKAFTLLTLFVVGSYLILSSVTAPVVNSQTSDDVVVVSEDQKRSEREALEQQLREVEQQIRDHEATIQGLQGQGKTLQSEINNLNAKISSLNLKIKAINLSLERLDREIDDHREQIQQTERDLEFNKAALTKALQVVYENQQLSLIEVLLQNPTLSGFFQNLNNLFDVQNNLSLTIGKVSALKEDLSEQKEELEIQRGDAAALKAYQDSQRALIQSTQKTKNDLLKATKGKEAVYQSIVKEAKKTAAQIRSSIFKLLGGGELTFEEAYKYAKFAEEATGVRAALILAVLDRESALGQNVGRCPYYDKEKDRYYMHPKRDVPYFLELTASLGLNAETIMVSCPISQDGTYGGAMGPSQFIPSTWKLYSQKVSEVTGNNPASPWRNEDAFAATALYLKDAGVKAGSTIEEERVAAAKYYAGANWRRHLWGYGERIVAQAKQFQEDIKILSS